MINPDSSVAEMHEYITTIWFLVPSDSPASYVLSTRTLQCLEIPVLSTGNAYIQYFYYRTDAVLPVPVRTGTGMVQV